MGMTNKYIPLAALTLFFACGEGPDFPEQPESGRKDGGVASTGGGNGSSDQGGGGGTTGLGGGGGLGGGKGGGGGGSNTGGGTSTGGGSSSSSSTGGGGSDGTGGGGSSGSTGGGSSNTGGGGSGDPTCSLPPPSSFKPNTSVGGGGSQSKQSDHFIVFGSDSADAALNLLEAAHQCFVEEWCWRSPGLSITSNSGTYYKFNVYAKPDLGGAAGLQQYDSGAGLAYIEVRPDVITIPAVTVHEFGHALTLTEGGWIYQKRTGFWWESVASFVADAFITSPVCANARNSHGIAQGRSIIELDTVIGNSHWVICMNQNYYKAWPFLSYLTNNPDNYPGMGRMVLPNMIRKHKRNNETPLHVLERLTAPVTVQTIVGRYWARMAYLDIGNAEAQKVFLSSRSRLNYKNLTSAGNQTYTPIADRQPKYFGSNIIPLKVTGNGVVDVQVANLGNGQTDSDFVATLSIRNTSSGAVRYVDLPSGSGQATIASGEEASLSVVNAPKTLYLYDPSSIGSSDPANSGLNYRVQLTGAVPAS